MSSYIDHHLGPVLGKLSTEVTHSWDHFTKARLSWLYGPANAVERQAQTLADIAAWKRLGRRDAA